jgi:hypothetical protein
MFYVGGYFSDPRSTLYFMDLSAKQLGWVLQTGKINPPGLKGFVHSNFALEVKQYGSSFCIPGILT